MDSLKMLSMDRASELRIARTTENRDLQEAVRQAGSPAKWLQKELPLVGAAAPPDLTDSELLAETRAWYDGAEARFRLCARCPAEGGACAEDDTAVRVGLRPEWNGRRLIGKACDRFAEYRTRLRLEKSGVSLRYLDSRFEKFDRHVTAEKLDQFLAFADRARSRGAWLVVTGPPRSGKTRLGVATMRFIIDRTPRLLLWYTDFVTIRSRLKQRYDDDEPTGDIFENARRSDVLVFDNLDPTRHVDEPWHLERVEAILRDRWLSGAATMVLTHDARSDFDRAWKTISDLSEAPGCSLS